ncbi:hypothetical protein [Lysobacter enzymogenes]|uniref:Uncharacterized protein n=1 Tax=Lysobacter enzymogenes TaxID=69 RepID=A0A0S2DD85_LYSEN|nr:hypothetical protein [Lysobacter enzymogenes]ALN56474.1 hypothetical protein GLE_1116 [Lysobacter enzymogenes]QCW25300.1 hypothetical protein FE772_06120 [Lysobacter enzymogenes]QQQ00200.1 hypothetical protein JHW41_19175 [Lysobacter enzymogenes]
MSTALTILGCAIGLVGALWLLALAFQEHLGWGLGSLLFVPVLALFAFLHWDRARTPALLNLAGLALAVIGVFMGAAPTREAG